MKKAFLLFMVLCASLASVGSVSAATTVPGGPFSSSFAVQNIGTAPASVMVEYYDAAGTMVFTSNHTIEVDDVLSVYVPAVVGLVSGEYSIVISSDQPVAATSNFSDVDSGASYSGFGEGAAAWFIPAVYDNYYAYFSEVYAQNVSDAAVDITLSIYAPGNSTPVYTNTKTAVPAKTSVNWSQKDLAELSTNVSYSAKVTATGNVVSMANIYGSGSVAQQLYSYNGFPAGATTFYVPALYKAYYGWNASLTVQNVSTSAANVTVAFSNGTEKSYTIPSNSSVAIYIPAVTELPNGLLSATVTSDNDVAVTVNISNPYNRAATYNGVAEATTTVNAPNVMKNYYNYSSSMTCQNLGAAATTMTVTYAGSTATETSPSIDPSKSWEIYMPAKADIPNGYNGSAVVVSNTTEPIACIINSNMEAAPYNTQVMDQLFSYNGVNK